MKKTKENIINHYLDYSIAIDLSVCIILYFISTLPYLDFILSNRENQLQALSSVINTDVSLAGFILAALTIIVTFKSNLDSKGVIEASNALELIFSTKHYDNIVAVFKIAILELVICFTVLYLLWLSSDNFSIHQINRINILSVYVSMAAIFRVLFILFIVLGLEKHKK